MGEGRGCAHTEVSQQLLSQTPGGALTHSHANVCRLMLDSHLTWVHPTLYQCGCMLSALATQSLVIPRSLASDVLRPFSLDFPLQGELPQVVASSLANILWIFPCKFDSTLLRVIMWSIRELALTVAARLHWWGICRGHSQMVEGRSWKVVELQPTCDHDTCLVEFE